MGVRKGGLKTNAFPITLFRYNEELLNLSTVANNLIRHLDITNDTPCLHFISYHIQKASETISFLNVSQIYSKSWVRSFQ